MLKVSADLDEEDAAFQFAGALLAPAAVLREHVGQRRVAVSLDELVLLKSLFGMSVQALLRRLLDLAIISRPTYVQGCKQVNPRGWRRHEPADLPPEQPAWLQRTALRAVSEGLISAAEAARLGMVDIPLPPPSPRRALLRLPAEERERLLAQQAETQQTELRPAAVIVASRLLVSALSRS